MRLPRLSDRERRDEKSPASVLAGHKHRYFQTAMKLLEAEVTVLVRVRLFETCGNLCVCLRFVFADAIVFVDIQCPRSWDSLPTVQMQ